MNRDNRGGNKCLPHILLEYTGLWTNSYTEVSGIAWRRSQCRLCAWIFLGRVGKTQILSFVISACRIGKPLGHPGTSHPKFTCLSSQSLPTVAFAHSTERNTENNENFKVRELSWALSSLCTIRIHNTRTMRNFLLKASFALNWGIRDCCIYVFTSKIHNSSSFGSPHANFMRILLWRAQMTEYVYIKGFVSQFKQI